MIFARRAGTPNLVMMTNHEEFHGRWPLPAAQCAMVLFAFGLLIMPHQPTRNFVQ
jgi:hypothetical protein